MSPPARTAIGSHQNQAELPRRKKERFLGFLRNRSDNPALSGATENGRRSLNLGVLALPAFFRPGVSERDCAVEYQLASRSAGTRFLVQNKISQPLELITQLRLRLFQGRFALRRHHLQRLRVEMLR